MESTIQFTLNGKSVNIKVDTDLKLLWVLRIKFGLTGTKYGCGEGFCGNCIVLVNNTAVRSCQTFIKEVKGKDVVTIEGLSKNGNLHPMQEAFIKHDALQCGYCTPGMILNAVGLLHKNPNPTKSEIIEEMEDNLCRCGSHNQIMDAIQEAAQNMREE
jgi:aerobic-type carbon monoxide dehydrogenase small subunit (CoxS/CutS family)